MYSLSCVRQLAHLTYNGEGGVAVQARGGLVKEEKDILLSGELNADTNALPLLKIEASCWDAYEGIDNIFHLEHRYSRLDIYVLLCQKDV